MRVAGAICSPLSRREPRPFNHSWTSNSASLTASGDRCDERPPGPPRSSPCHAVSRTPYLCREQRHALDPGRSRQPARRLGDQHRNDVPGGLRAHHGPMNRRVVAEPRRLSRANRPDPDMEQEADIEDVSRLPLGQAHPSCEVRADEAGAHRRFHRKAVPQIHHDRQPRQQIGEPEPGTHRRKSCPPHRGRHADPSRRPPDQRSELRLADGRSGALVRQRHAGADARTRFPRGRPSG